LVKADPRAHDDFIERMVEPIHPKAMQVILTTHEERHVWMRAPCSGRPHDARIVARGADKEDRAAA
jgi:putative SOS response-associated peptidase YedK